MVPQTAALSFSRVSFSLSLRLTDPLGDSVMSLPSLPGYPIDASLSITGPVSGYAIDEIVSPKSGYSTDPAVSIPRSHILSDSPSSLSASSRNSRRHSSAAMAATRTTISVLLAQVGSGSASAAAGRRGNSDCGRRSTGGTTGGVSAAGAAAVESPAAVVVDGASAVVVAESGESVEVDDSLAFSPCAGDGTGVAVRNR